MRRRVKRAAELGLTYRRYEVLVLGGGDIRAMLVEGGTLVIVAPNASVSVGLDAAVMNKLAAVTDCRRLLLAGRGGGGAPWITGAEGSALFETAIEVPALRPLAAPPVKADRVALSAGLRPAGEFGCAGWRRPPRPGLGGGGAVGGLRAGLRVFRRLTPGPNSANMTALQLSSPLLKKRPSRAG